jgi:hypothetical protein
MDFVAGWLGTLPGFVDSRWSIDIGTGLSLGDTYVTKALDNPNSDINRIMYHPGMCLDKDADLIWTGSCHGFMLSRLKSLNELGQVDIVYIDLTGADIDSIYWEFLAKTFLTKRRHISDCLNQNFWVIDRNIINKEKQLISDQDRIEKFIQLSKRKNQITQQINNIKLDGIKHTNLLYTDLFQPTGSYYLLDQLRLVASERHHELWQSALKLSTTPDQVEAWGKLWIKSDLLN